MKNTSENILDKIAEESGFAAVVLDDQGREIGSSNNNSICSILYHSHEFAPKCAEFCGEALKRSEGAEDTIEYHCHVGLYCRAKALKHDEKSLVAIVGRAFTKADSYRQVTERAISGDLQQFPPDQLFENVLIAGSDNSLQSLTTNFESLSASEIAGTFALVSKAVESPPESADEDILGISEIAEAPLPPRAIESDEVLELGPRLDDRLSDLFPDEIMEWRSIFGSFLTLDYTQACELILAFLSKRYDLDTMLWLERQDQRLETVAGLGELFERRSVKIAISGDEPRLVAAGRDGSALELAESRQDLPPDVRRTISLFPVMIGDEVRSVLALGSAVSRDLAKRLTQFCRMVASRIEILRLRNEVARRDTLSEAVTKFNENLQKIDGVDFWLHLTQVSAELLRAERASLLLRTKSNELRPMASVGIRADLSGEEKLGERFAKRTLEKRKPLLVKDLSSINIALAPPDRRYRTDSFISYPIEIGERGIAILNLTDKADGAAFSEYDLEVLRAITPQISVAIDRTQLKEKAGEYAQLSVTDSLTGLLNRRYLETRLTEEISRSDRHSYPMSFMMLDVDEFKSYNDRFGHPAGDEALKLVGHIVKDTLRAADVAARYGGEEFAVLLPQTTSQEAEVIAERLRQKIEEAAFQNRQVTVSIGIASCNPSPSSSMRDLISAADKALYRAKQKGRNNVQNFGNFEEARENVH